jgi:hypothetical protein
MQEGMDFFVPFSIPDVLSGQVHAAAVLRRAAVRENIAVFDWPIDSRVRTERAHGCFCNHVRQSVHELSVQPRGFFFRVEDEYDGPACGLFQIRAFRPEGCQKPELVLGCGVENLKSPLAPVIVAEQSFGRGPSRRSVTH